MRSCLPVTRGAAEQAASLCARKSGIPCRGVVVVKTVEDGSLFVYDNAYAVTFHNWYLVITRNHGYHVFPIGDSVRCFEQEKKLPDLGKLEKEEGVGVRTTGTRHHRSG